MIARISAANYSITSIVPFTNTSQNLAKVSITYTAADGKIYQSALADQDAGSTFEIVSVESAGVNENGQTIKKVKLRFNAILFNGSKNIKISNGEAVIAAAYR